MQGSGSRPLAVGRFPLAVIALLVVFAVVAAVAPPETAETVGVLGIVVGDLIAGVLFFRRSRNLERRERLAWRLLGATFLIAAGGVLIVGTVSSLGYQVPAFGPFDMIFLGGYVVLAAGLVAIARMESGGVTWARTLLDSAIGAVGALAIVWETALGPLVMDQDIPIWERVIASTYPVLDVALIVCLFVVVLRRTNYHLDPRLILLGLATLCQVIADLAYMHSGAGATFQEAEPLHWLFMMTTALAVATASIVDRRPKPREFADRSTPLWAVVWPYTVAAALVPLHLVKVESMLGPRPQDRVVLYSLIAVGLIIFLRQMVAIHENRFKVQRQSRELVGSVSHELRTPLTAVVGFLDLLGDESIELDEQERAEMMTMVTSQANHMSRIVTDLIMLARGSTAKMEVTQSPVDLAAMCHGAARLVDVEFGLDLEFDIAVEPGRQVVVDGGRMTQALSNLLGNAVRYGGGRCLVVAHRNAVDLTIEVHDNGPGVPARHELAIWNQFERGAHRLDAVTPGLGVGLAIVKSVVEAHGGTADYRPSERLGGACFVMTIPQSRMTVGDLVAGRLRPGVVAAHRESVGQHH